MGSCTKRHPAVSIPPEPIPCYINSVKEVFSSSMDAKYLAGATEDNRGTIHYRFLSNIKSIYSKTTKLFHSLAKSSNFLLFNVDSFFYRIIKFVYTTVRSLIQPIIVILFSKQNYKCDTDIGIDAKFMLNWRVVRENWDEPHFFAKTSLPPRTIKINSSPSKLSFPGASGGRIAFHGVGTLSFRVGIHIINDQFLECETLHVALYHL